MAGRRESLAPMWAILRKNIELEDPIPLVDQVYLVCTQRAATVDEEAIRTQTEMFQINTTANVEETFKKITGHNIHKVSSWSYDTNGHAEQCVERYDELAKTSVSHLRQKGTPCSDDHHLKEYDFEVVGECALVSTQIFLKCGDLVGIGWLDILFGSTHTCKSSHKVEQSVRLEIGKVELLHSVHEGPSTILSF